MKEKKNFYIAIKYYIVEMWKHKKAYFVYILIHGVAMGIFTYCFIRIPSSVINMLGTGTSDWNKLLVLFFGVIVCNLVAGFARYLYTPLGYQIRYKLLQRLIEKNLYMPLEIYEDPKYLDFQNTLIRPIGGTHGVQRFYLSLGDIMGALGTIIVSISILFEVHYILVLMTCTWLVVYGVIRLKSNAKIDYLYNNNESIFRENEYLNNLSTEVSYAKDIRVFDMNKYLNIKRDESIEKSCALSKKVSSVEAKLSNVDAIYQFIRDSFMYIILAIYYFTKRITIADFSSYSALIIQLNGAFTLFINNMAELSEYYTASIALFEHLDGTISDEGVLPLAKYDEFEIEFKDVSFHYPSSERMIYSNLNFKIKKGKKLAIIGLNGVGKTTMMKLLMRLYKPTSGLILFNGVNIQNIKKDEYFKLFAPVFQELNIFPFSLRDNLKFSNDVTDEILINSLKEAGIYDDLKGYGLDQELTRFIDSEGLILSGGQTQKIIMARALAYDRDILILDEPTSALDAIAEYEFYNKINTTLKDKTILFISHRLASTSFCDQILLVDDLNIAEYGTHDELMSTKGKYYELFNIQSKSYQEEVTYE